MLEQAVSIIENSERFAIIALDSGFTTYSKQQAKVPGVFLPKFSTICRSLTYFFCLCTFVLIV